jgi:hypothetical protein
VDSAALLKVQMRRPAHDHQTNSRDCRQANIDRASATVAQVINSQPSFGSCFFGKLTASLPFWMKSVSIGAHPWLKTPDRLPLYKGARG